MKAFLDVDSLYPHYTLSTEGYCSWPVEVTEKEYADYIDARYKYFRLQDWLAQKLHQAQKEE